MVRLAAFFYGTFVISAVLWNIISGQRSFLFSDPLVSNWSRVFLGGLAGLVLGFVVVWFSQMAVALWPWATELYRWFAEVLGVLSKRDCLLLAIMSAIGEELFFRGAMQPTLGLIPTTIIFALMHFPPRRQFWPWTASAGIFGLLFGLLFKFSGNLLGPIIAHLVINACNLRSVASIARRRSLSPSEPYI